MVALGELASPNGQELLAEFIQYGHQKPFEEIVRRYAGMVFNVCFRITKDKHEAEDAVQAVFLTLALQAKRGADIKALGPWLQQVAKRLALDVRRSKKRRKNREERHHVEQTLRRESILGEALPSADLDELKTVLHEELQKLPAKYRMPLILHYFGGLSRDEMAAELNCKPSTLGVRIFRGREMLAGRLSGRGINISTAVLAVMLGDAVRRAVSDKLISSTSHAATAMMAGHSGAGLLPAHVIGLSHRATSAMVLGKVRMTALTALITAASFGAGAKALKMLPTVNVQQMISNQLQRLIRPLLGPLNRPMLSQTTGPAKPVSSPAMSAVVTDFQSTTIAATTPLPISVGRAASAAAAPIVAGESTAVTPSGFVNYTYHPVTITSASPEDRSTASTAASSVDAAAESTGVETSNATSLTSGAGFGGYALPRNTQPLPPQSMITTASLSRSGDIILSNNNLVISGSSSSATALYLIPAVGGTVTESSAGQLRGWGTIEKTGTLENNGQVVADGQGIDRTLNLTMLTAVETASSTITNTATSPVFSTLSQVATAPASPSKLSNNSSGKTSSIGPPAPAGSCPALPVDGWYAVNHGRLTMGLQASMADPLVYTWGDNPNAQLSLTNSVRVSVGNADDAPTDLSLLAPDRDDGPSLSQIKGATIGVWEVNTSSGSIADADLTICYDSLLANALGASQDSIELWSLNDASGNWQEVNQGSYALDTTDHLIFGQADDFSYFAVSAMPAPGTDVDLVRAHQLAVINGASSGAQIGSSAGSSQSVPEPVALPLIASSLALLGRRRRRTLSESPV